jgi:hypothetical protein
MLNAESKKKALARLEGSCAQHDEAARVARDKAGALHALRAESADQVLGEAEQYFSGLANAPREFLKAVGEYRVAYERFGTVVAKARENAERAATVSGSVAGAGAMAALSVAAFGPTAAIVIASTFGAASTGTAIGSLSGAVAAHTALAWLGGGAIAAGGGGMAAGQALLALAGPVGWGIGLVALGGAGCYASKKNAEIAAESNAKAEDIEGRTTALQSAIIEIDGSHALTQKHARSTIEEIARLRSDAPADYREFTNEMKEVLAALKNNVESLSQLLAGTATA